MTCNFTENFELARNLPYSLFEKIAEICPATYIRPVSWHKSSER
jgi:hypothetical protein